MPSGEYIKTYCERANSRNFHVWNSHSRHPTRLFDRLILSNSWTSCYNMETV